MKIAIETRIENLRKDFQVFRSSNSFNNSKSCRYPPRLKSNAIALINEGVPIATLSRAIGMTGRRVSQWVKGSRVDKNANPHFKELKMSVADAAPIECEARIVTANGISIFIPISALTSKLIASIGGHNV